MSLSGKSHWGMSLPGNMNGILEDNSARANAIIIPDKVTYEKALTLVPEDKNIRSCHLAMPMTSRKIMANLVMPLLQRTQTKLSVWKSWLSRSQM